ncbi:hypothetical protein FRC01_010786, partial [Tulasnella sp. 417]
FEPLTVSPAKGFSSTNASLGPGSNNYVYIDGTTQIPAGSTPQGGPNNSFSASTGVASPAESAVWIYNPVTQEITVQWINPDGSTLPNFIVYSTASGTPILLVTGDVTAFGNTYGSSPAVVSSDWSNIAFGTVLLNQILPIANNGIAKPEHSQNHLFYPEWSGTKISFVHLTPQTNPVTREMSQDRTSIISTSLPLVSHTETPFKINDLPNEIVWRIFEDWCQAVMGTPTLWTQISLPPYIQHLEEKVTSYLERSKTLPVGVIVGRRTSIGCLRVTTLFQSHLERIRSLTCAVSVGSVDVLWSDINKMTALEELAVEKSPEISPTITSQRGNNLNLPSLKKLRISNVDIPLADTVLPNIEDLQLVYAHFQGVLTMDRLFDALARFTTLKKLFIGFHSNFLLYIRFWDENTGRPKGPTELPLLKELKLKGLTDRQVEMVLKEILAPDLESILLLEGKNEGFVRERWPTLSDRFPRAMGPRLIK